MEKLRVASDVEIETVLTEKKSVKRIKVSIETDEKMPVKRGQIIFEFDGLLVVSKTICVNMADKFLKSIK